LGSEGFEIDADKVLQRAYIGRETLMEMCKAAARYAGVEKAGLHPMLVGNADVIDAEVALTRVSSPDDEDEEDAGSPDRKQDRIDAAIAVLENDVPTIRFYEAKHFTNSALRASGDSRPDVVRQIRDYEKALETYRARLSAGYVETAKALLRFNEMRIQAFGASAGRSIAPAIRQIADTGQPPAIDTRPHLIIYGFDKAQRDDRAWKEGYFKTLIQELPDRVLAIGSPTRKTVFNRPR
jgi:hypothetical protein